MKTVVWSPPSDLNCEIWRTTTSPMPIFLLHFHAFLWHKNRFPVHEAKRKKCLMECYNLLEWNRIDWLLILPEKFFFLLVRRFAMCTISSANGNIFSSLARSIFFLCLRLSKHEKKNFCEREFFYVFPFARHSFFILMAQERQILTLKRTFVGFQQTLCIHSTHPPSFALWGARNYILINHNFLFARFQIESNYCQL